MINSVLFFLIGLPFFCGFILLFLGNKPLKKNLALMIFSLALIFSLAAFFKPPADFTIGRLGGFSLTIGLDKFSKLILVFVNLFAFLVCLYSKYYMENKGAYFSYLCWLLAACNLEVFAGDLILFSIAWGVTLLILYGLLRLGSAKSANKAITILGFAYIVFIFGIYLYYKETGTTGILYVHGLGLHNPKVWMAFIFMLMGGLAKSGCAPFHTWIPTAAEDAPIPVMAILPASLDKLLGIYFLSKVCVELFILNDFILGLLMIVGSLTIITAVMLALIQHDLRKLLSYHAISQVGYMVVGIGTAAPVGVVGAVFHMFNNAIYKSGLFLVGGAAEQKRHTFKLEELGGLAGYMPLTFLAGTIFALSISGIPPLNGFASKWLLYQGLIIGFSGTANGILRFVYLFALLAAMFGSALTLASFVKFIHAVFLGQDNSPEKKKVGEAPMGMLIPVLFLAGLCVLLGLFNRAFINIFIQPWLSETGVQMIGDWNSFVVTFLIVLALILGLLFWKMSVAKSLRKDNFFIGGERADFNPNFPATEFYKTLEDMSCLRNIYRFLNLKMLDIYTIISLILNPVLCLFKRPGRKV